MVKTLLEKSAPFKILAVTRNVNSTSAKKLAQKSPNITLIQGNLDDPAAIFENVKRQISTPVWGVFSVQVSPQKKGKQYPKIDPRLTNKTDRQSQKRRRKTPRNRSDRRVHQTRRQVFRVQLRRPRRREIRSKPNPSPTFHFQTRDREASQKENKRNRDGMDDSPTRCLLRQPHAGLLRQGVCDCMADVSKGQAAAINRDE